MIKKIINQNKEYIFCIILLLLITGINIYSYIDIKYNTSFYPIEGTNSFSFWYYVRSLNLGQILVFISPIIIVVCGVKGFYEKLCSGFYQNIILKKGYNKFIKSEFLKCYIKGILIFPIFSIIIFMIGLIVFNDKITLLNSTIQILYLPFDSTFNPYLYVILSTVLTLLYGFFIINTTLILVNFTKKFYLLIISTFIAINACNFIVSNILLFVANILGSEKLFTIFSNVNIYDGYSSEAPIIIAYITICIYCAISSIIVYLLYKKKERLFDLYE